MRIEFWQSDFREYVGVVSHKDFVERRDLFEKKIKLDAHRELVDLGYLVMDQITEWFKKPSFIQLSDDDGEWCCRVVSIIGDCLEERVRLG